MEPPVDRHSSKFVAALRGDAGTLPPGPQALSDEQVAASHRARLVAGLAEVLSAKRYADVTVADVVACAQVSRRTFYGHFPDKEACFLATYEACADLMMDWTARAVIDGGGRTYDERIAMGVRMYLGTLASEPGLARAFLHDVLSVGPEALRRRRVVNDRLAAMIRAVAEQHRAELPDGYAIHPDMAQALVGALEELVLIAISDERTHDLPRLTETATRLVHAALVAGA
ncbi:MAG TPA: TetR/AcrR family transcriptional regulator [Baekduia sp.]|nr:TetR/AcrR family transcriptional regulator [Baekduia sp.]